MLHPRGVRPRFRGPGTPHQPDRAAPGVNVHIARYHRHQAPGQPPGLRIFPSQYAPSDQRDNDPHQVFHPAHFGGSRHTHTVSRPVHGERPSQNRGLHHGQRKRRAESAAPETGLWAGSSGGCGLWRILAVPVAVEAPATGGRRAHLSARRASTAEQRRAVTTELAGRGATWGSGLSADEFAAVKSVGFEPGRPGIRSRRIPVVRHRGSQLSRDCGAFPGPPRTGEGYGLARLGRADRAGALRRVPDSDRPDGR